MIAQSPRLTEALRLAAKGTPVFPIAVGGKRPASVAKNGFHDATTDADQIEMWWMLADWNVGVSPGHIGLTVVDLDDKDGKSGSAEWKKLVDELGAEPTYTVQTPSGGFHLYFKGEATSSASRIADGVDTRAQGGYVVVPPSVADGGEYRVVDSRPMAALPEWVVPRLRRAHTASLAEHTDAGDKDPQTLARVKEILLMAEPAVEYQGSDTATLTLASLCMDFISPMKTLEMMLEHWVPRCEGEWDAEWVEQKVLNALTYRTLPVGCDYYPPISETFAFLTDPAAPEMTDAEVIAQIEAEMKTEKRKNTGRFKFTFEAEMDATPELEWLIPDILPREALAVMFGTTGSFKSFIAGDIAMSYAAGLNVFDRTPGDHGLVVYAAGEGMRGMKLDRRRAWKALKGVTDELASTFTVTEAPYMAIDTDGPEFINALHSLPSKPHLIIIDTYTEMMAGLEEFSLKDISKATMFCKALIKEFGCTVLLIAHTNEAGGLRGGKGPLWGSADTVLEVVRGADQAMHCEVRVRKQKDGTEDIAPIVLEAQEIAGSLAFAQMEQSKISAMRESRREVTDGPNVGAALRRLNATEAAKAQTLDVLAAELCTSELQGVARDEAIATIKAKLKKNSETRLAGYCDNGSWYLRNGPS